MITKWKKEEEDWFRKQINLIKGMHTGWDMSKEVIDAYCEHLSMCDFNVIKSIVESCWSRKDFPVIGDIKEEYYRCKKRNDNSSFSWSKDEKINSCENENVDNYGVVMSMMYLYYTHGWIGNIEKSDALVSYFEKIYPGENYDFDKIRILLNEEVVRCYVKENIMI